eukprot:311725-Chlamydomonas_euryale.AAC.1
MEPGEAKKKLYPHKTLSLPDLLTLNLPAWRYAVHRGSAALQSGLGAAGGTGPWMDRPGSSCSGRRRAGWEA